MKLIKIKGGEFTIDSALCIPYASRDNVYTYRLRVFTFVTGGGVMICKNDRLSYLFFNIPQNSNFQIDAKKRRIIVEIDDISPSNMLKLIIYKYFDQKYEKIDTRDKLKYYGMMNSLASCEDTWMFHSSISSKIKDRKKWYRSQIQFLKGNELPMCWTNHDLAIKYQ